MMFRTAKSGNRRRKLIWMTLISLSAPLACGLVEAAEGPSPCAKEGALERQVIPRDAVIGGAESTRVQLYKTHPSECAGGNACQATASLVAGEGVQVIRTCGGYVRVRYFGESGISTGWIKTTALEDKREDNVDAQPWKVTASSMRDLPAFLEGYYSTPAQHCIRFDENMEPQPCDSHQRDCMVIKRVDDRHAQFSVYSPQVNGAVCKADGIAELDGTELIYEDRDKSSPTVGSGLRFDVLQGEVVLRAFTGPGSVPQPFCGHGAQLDQFAISLNDRQEIKQQACPVP